MDYQIHLSGQNYCRLESHAKGFETPENVIERLLDHYEVSHKAGLPLAKIDSSRPDKLDLIIIPSDEEFKKALIATQGAWICLKYIDGTQQVKYWSAKQFQSTSSLRGNLFSGHLRGWKRKGVCRAKIAISKQDVMEGGND